MGAIGIAVKKLCPCPFSRSGSIATMHRPDTHVRPPCRGSTPLAQLNPRQREAVHYIDGPCLVLAGAGSGKTSVITRKIAYLVEECGMAARNIAALTFTNKAAREMKERVSSLLKGKANAKGLTVSTFHNLGLNIIRKEHKVLGFKPGFSIFDSDDARLLLKELMLKDNELDSDHLDLVQNQISNWKNDLTSPESAASYAASPAEEKIALVYKRYNEALRAYNAVDFDDLILIPATLFQTQAEVLKRWQHKIRYLLVDEYQDTNTSQYLLVKLLIGDRGSLTVVGDDDQSIYAWRGARPENLSQLKTDFPSLRLIKLEQNYRSTSRILRTANHLIAHNPHEFDKALWSDMGLGEKIRVVRCTNEDGEAERVATEILHQRLKRQIKFSDFAVLYRGNHQSRLLEIKLQQQREEAARKKETRAKIILGGFLVAHAKKGEQRFIELFDQAMSEASERDQKTLMEYRKIVDG